MDIGIIEGEKLLIKVSDGEGNFVHPCLINTDRKIKFTVNTTDTEVRACPDVGAPAKIFRKVKSTDFDVTGAGKVDKTSVLFYLTWATPAGAGPKDVEIYQAVSGAEGGFIGTGQLILTEFELGGAAGEYQDCSLSFKPAASFEWEANA